MKTIARTLIASLVVLATALSGACAVSAGPDANGDDTAGDTTGEAREALNVQNPTPGGCPAGFEMSYLGLCVLSSDPPSEGSSSGVLPPGCGNTTCLEGCATREKSCDAACTTSACRTDCYDTYHACTTVCCA